MNDAACCAVCTATAADLWDRTLVRLACGHILCDVCRFQGCLVCAGEQPTLDEPMPIEQCVSDGAALLWAYGELYDVPDAARYAAEQLLLVLTCLRLWAEDAGMDTAEAWRASWQRSVAIKQARKASECDN